MRALLDSQSTMVLSTSDGAGSPASAPLFFIADSDLSLYWLSSHDSRHSRNLADRPEAAVSAFAPVSNWRSIRGVQMSGMVEPAADRSILEAYCARFGIGPELEGIVESSVLYRFRPRWVRYLDNSLGFGFRDEIELA